VGSNFRRERKNLDSLKGEIANKTTNRITFIDIHEVEHENGRVILFEIPAAPKGIPISFDGHYYGRDGESLSPLNLEEIERIRAQATQEDWSAALIPDTSLEDLDPEALRVARENYKKKFPAKAPEVDEWDDLTFLNKAKLAIKGKLTRTALLLLGKDESEHFLLPADPKIRWILKDHQGNDRDYALFGIPLLLAVDKVYAKIRNLKYRYLPEGTLFPEEIDQYEPYSIREAINNCIAHQDYTLAGRINVIECEDSLIFTNLGSFVPGDVQRVVIENAPEEHYRNRFLSVAMFSLNMVDTAGGGIRRMFLFQKDRFFPLPDYDISERRVQLTLTGKILDLDYAQLLISNSDLSLLEIMGLDKVQKKKPLNDDEEKRLKSKSLIEGRKPNFYIAKPIAQKTGQKASYSKNKAFDKQYYIQYCSVKPISE
jgi:ATP-dependent DNA helicase RecG